MLINAEDAAVCCLLRVVAVMLLVHRRWFRLTKAGISDHSKESAR